MFQNLKDLDNTQPPLRFMFDPEVGLAVAADDVIMMIQATQSILAKQGILMAEGLDPETAIKVTEAAVLGCEAMDIVRKGAESIFLEARFHAPEGTEPTTSTTSDGTLPSDKSPEDKGRKGFPFGFGG